VKTSTPTTETKNCSALDPMRRFTSEAMTKPIRASCKVGPITGFMPTGSEPESPQGQDQEEYSRCILRILVEGRGLWPVRRYDIARRARVTCIGNCVGDDRACALMLNL